MELLNNRYAFYMLGVPNYRLTILHCNQYSAHETPVYPPVTLNNASDYRTNGLRLGFGSDIACREIYRKTSNKRPRRLFEHGLQNPGV